MLKVTSRTDLDWIVPDAVAVGRWLAEIVPPELLQAFLDHIDLARRYQRRIALCYWWERAGVRHERIATFHVRGASQTIDLDIEHLGSVPVEDDAT